MTDHTVRRSASILVVMFCYLLASALSLRASMVLFTYDFPGTPGSGIAANQTVPTQPDGATFLDFIQNGGLIVHDTPVDTFNSANWSPSVTIDPTQFDSFMISANAGRSLDLTQLSFDVKH